MKLFQLLLLTCYIYGSFGATSQGFAPVTDKRHIDNGYTCQLGDLLLTPGTHFNVKGQCSEYQCGEDSRVLVNLCGKSGNDCLLVYPAKKDYPYCCLDTTC